MPSLNPTNFTKPSLSAGGYNIDVSASDSFRLLEDGTSFRLLEDGTSKRLLESGELKLINYTKSTSTVTNYAIPAGS